MLLYGVYTAFVYAYIIIYSFIKIHIEYVLTFSDGEQLSQIKTAYLNDFIQHLFKQGFCHVIPYITTSKNV